MLPYKAAGSIDGWTFELVGVDRTRADRDVYYFEHGRVATIIPSRTGPFAIPGNDETTDEEEGREEGEDEGPARDEEDTHSDTCGEAAEADRPGQEVRPDPPGALQDEAYPDGWCSCRDEDVDWCKSWEGPRSRSGPLGHQQHLRESRRQERFLPIVPEDMSASQTEAESCIEQPGDEGYSIVTFLEESKLRCGAQVKECVQKAADFVEGMPCKAILSTGL